VGGSKVSQKQVWKISRSLENRFSLTEITIYPDYRWFGRTPLARRSARSTAACCRSGSVSLRWRAALVPLRRRAGPAACRSSGVPLRQDLRAAFEANFAADCELSAQPVVYQALTRSAT